VYWVTVVQTVLLGAAPLAETVDDATVADELVLEGGTVGVVVYTLLAGTPVMTTWEEYEVTADEAVDLALTVLRP
jgi:hypothetical protein